MSPFDGCLLCARLNEACIESQSQVIRLDRDLRAAIAAADQSRIADLRAHLNAAEIYRSNAYEVARDHQVSVHGRASVAGC